MVHMQHIEDRYYHRLPAGPASQGDIWTCLPGAPHASTQVTGIIITPRCDFAHEKTRVLNFVPIVSLDELLTLEGGFQLLEQEEKNTRKNLHNLAAQLDVGELYDVGADAMFIGDVVRSRTEALATDKHRERLEAVYSKFAQQLMRLERIQEALSRSTTDISELDELLPETAFQSYKRDVLRNAKADLFFLPPCTDLLPVPSVALLRSVVACSYDLVRTAISSLTPADWDRARKQHSSGDFNSAPKQPERILRLRTPYVEALMARFCSLFGRIGTRDLTAEEIALYLSWRK